MKNFNYLLTFIFFLTFLMAFANCASDKKLHKIKKKNNKSGNDSTQEELPEVPICSLCNCLNNTAPVNTLLQHTQKQGAIIQCTMKLLSYQILERSIFPDEIWKVFLDVIFGEKNFEIIFYSRVMPQL